MGNSSDIYGSNQYIAAGGSNKSQPYGDPYLNTAGGTQSHRGFYNNTNSNLEMLNSV